MNLQADRSFRRNALCGCHGMLKIGNQSAVEPYPDSSWLPLADNAHGVPGLLLEIPDSIGIPEDIILRPGAVDFPNIAFGPVIQRNLMAFGIRTHAKENPAVEGPFNLRFQKELKILIGFFGP